MSNEARRAAFNLIPETCPEVDRLFYTVGDALGDASDGVKAITTKFREELISALSEAYDLEKERDKLAQQLEEALAEVQELKSVIRELEQEQEVK